MAANAARLNALIALNNKAMDMAEKNPFDDKAALRAHRSFTQAAQGKAGRKISMGVDVEAIEADMRAGSWDCPAKTSKHGQICKRWPTTKTATVMRCA